MNKILLFLLLPVFACAQTDSTTLYFKHIEDKDIRTVCDLSDIQIIKIYCEDSLLKGKVFNVIVKEFKMGKPSVVMNAGVTSAKQHIPFVYNGDTMIYEIDYHDKAGIDDSTNSITITFGGILRGNKFKFKVEYPGLSCIEDLKGNMNYSLRMANPCGDEKMKVPIGKEYPVLAYTPPFDTGSSIQSYCMLGDEKVTDWYAKFKVKHYYIIYLVIN